MAENKTRPKQQSVTELISSIDDHGRRTDVKKTAVMMAAANGKNARMWDPRIVGCGEHHYKYCESLSTIPLNLCARNTRQSSIR